jgi:hypothetical protein
MRPGNVCFPKYGTVDDLIWSPKTNNVVPASIADASRLKKQNFMSDKKN